MTVGLSVVVGQQQHPLTNLHVVGASFVISYTILQQPTHESMSIATQPVLVRLASPSLVLPDTV